MKWVAFILTILMLAGSAGADFVELVKKTKNSVGLYCSEIPKLVEARGFKAVKSDWREGKMNGITKVSLKVTAQKETQVDTMYVAYAWNPVWIWGVENKTRAVSPLNNLAKDWMEGRI